MKHVNMALLVLLISLNGFAQYKKAGYFGKDGRIYSLTTRLHMLGGDNGTVMGYTLTTGRDTDGKQFFTTMDFHFIPSYKVVLSAPDDMGGYSKGTFTTKLQFGYGVNFGYFLLKNENDQHRVKPYLLASLGAKIFGKLKEEEETGSNLASDLPFSFNLGGGAGVYYYVLPWLALQGEGGYSYQKSLNENGIDESYVLPSHPFVKLGVCFRITGE